MHISWDISYDILQQDNFLWDDKSRLTFSNWNLFPRRYYDYDIYTQDNDNQHGADVTMYDDNENDLEVELKDFYSRVFVKVPSSIITNALRHIQPIHTSHCVAMASGDINQNPWIVIPCKSRFSGMVPICEKRSRRKNDGASSIRNLILAAQECPEGWTMVHSRCYILVSHPVDYPIGCPQAEELCSRQRGYLAWNVQLHQWLPLLRRWINDKIRNFIFMHSAQGCLLVKNKRVHYNESIDDWHTAQDNTLLHKSSPENVGHSLCETNSEIRKAMCSFSTASCGDGTCVLIHHWCDGVTDCPLDAMDEQNCSHVCTGSEQCFSSCPIETCTCSSLYFHCMSHGCIPMSKICDGISDCVHGEDETYCQVKLVSAEHTGSSQPEIMLTVNVSSVRNNIPCSDPFSVPCMDNSGLCYHRAKHCTLDWDVAGRLMYCSSGFHLKWCASVQCPTMFKCPVSYCIPLRRVCDGRGDCPHREDEEGCSLLSCPGMLRCRGDQLCIHPREVCDGVINCPLSWDDETFCPTFICPIGCMCHGWAMVCHTEHFMGYMGNADKMVHFSTTSEIVVKDLGWLSPMRSLRNLFLVNTGIFTLKKNVFIFQAMLITLDLSKNKIHFLRTGCFDGLISLRYLSLSQNPIYEIGIRSFSASPYLQTLDLSMMALTKLEMATFYGLKNLGSLNISSNWITYLDGEKFIGLKYLKDLDLRKNPLDVAKGDIFLLFPRQSISSVYFDQSYFCCNAPGWINCTAGIVISSKCADLLGEGLSLRTYTGMVSLMVLGLNFLSITWNAGNMKQTAQMVLIINQSATDLITGSWLLICLIADQYYADVFYMTVYKWRTGLICHLFGTLASASLFLTTTFYFLLTLDRYLHILQIAKLKKNIVTLSVIVIWAFVLLVNIIENSYHPLDNDFCLSLLSQRLPYNLSFLGLELIMIACCIPATIQIVRYCIRTRISCGRSVTLQDKKMFTRILAIPFLYIAYLVVKLIVVLAHMNDNFKCVLLGAMSLLVPATNPIVFTLSTKSFLKRKKKPGPLKNKQHKWGLCIFANMTP